MITLFKSNQIMQSLNYFIFYLMNKLSPRIFFQFNLYFKFFTKAQMSSFILGNADFDLETKIRKVSKEVFEVLLKSHNHIFEFIGKSQSKFDRFEQRIHKIESNNDKLMDSVESRFKNVTKLKQDVQQFKSYCYKGFTETKSGINSYQQKLNDIKYQLKENFPIIRTLSGEIDLMKQNTTEYRALIEKNQNEIQERILRETQQINKKISNINTDFNLLNTEICQTRASLQGRQETLLTLIKDISLYRFDKSEINSKINQLFAELEGRALRDELFENKKYFDDKMMGYFENVNKSFENLSVETRNKLKSFYGEFSNSISNQIEANQMFRNQTVKDFSDSKISLETQMNRLLNEVRGTKSSIQDQIDMVMKKFNERQTFLKEMKTDIDLHYTQHSENNDLTKKSLGEFSMGIEELKNTVRNTREKVEKFLKKQTEGASRLQQLENNSNNILEKLMVHIQDYNQKLNNQNTWNFETIKLIHQNEIEIDEKIKAEAQISQKYFNDLNQLFVTIKDKLEYLDQLSKDLQKFKQRFQQQIKQNDSINTMVTQKIEQSFNTITKLKTDFMLKVQSILKEVGKALVQVKNIEKIVINLASFTSILNQICTINISYELTKEFQIAKQQMKQQINPKYSSLFQGFIVELENKQSHQLIKYRGEVIPKIILLSYGLQYLVTYQDNLRKAESLKNFYEYGKSVYKNMLPVKRYNQQTRKNTVSVRTVNKKDSSFSQFPKIPSTHRPNKQ